MYGADNFGYSGNVDLKPEKSYNQEIGLSFKSEKIESEISIFDTKIQDMITYANSTYSNDYSGNSKMQGLDLKLDINFNKFKISNNYAHVHSVDSSNTWLKRRPHDILNTSLMYYVGDLLISPEMNFYGKHSDTHSSNYSTILIKERTLFDLKIAYLDFTFQIKNLFDDSFERPHGYNQGGREMRLEYSYSF